MMAELHDKGRTRRRATKEKEIRRRKVSPDWYPSDGGSLSALPDR
jgi:hypothetical protein